MKVRVPREGLVKDLVRGALLLGKHDLQLSDANEVEVDREVVRKALERAIDLTWDIPILATNNDVMNPQGTKGPLTKLSLECYNAELPNSLGMMLNFALKRLDELEGCGKEHAHKVALMRVGTEGSEAHRIDALTLTLAYAGFAWYLGKVRFSLRDFRMFLLLPIELREDPMNFLQEIRADRMGKLIPEFLTYDWALDLWIATNYNINGVFKVYFVKKHVNTIDAFEYMTVDTKAEREAIAKVFDKPLDEVKTHLNAVLRNITDYNPNPIAMKFGLALYQATHGMIDLAKLKAFDVNGLADTSGGIETQQLIRDIVEVVQSVKI